MNDVFLHQISEIMRIYSTLFFIHVFVCIGHTQLTVEKIMQDPVRWVGTSPDNLMWSDDSQTIYFTWNPEMNVADSLYKLDISNIKDADYTKYIQKVSIEERQALPDKYSVAFTKDGTRKLFTRGGDIFIIDVKTGIERRLTQTLEYKSNPVFNSDESGVIFKKGNNLYVIDIQSGLISNLTNFVTEAGKNVSPVNDADKALERDQLELFDVLSNEKKHQEATDNYNKRTKRKTLGEISTGGKQITGLSSCPDMRYVFYKLRENNKASNATFVPNYVTISGYTSSIPGRTKVGVPDAVAEAYIYDCIRDTIIYVRIDSIPGIADMPEYLKEYRKDTTVQKPKARPVEVYGPVWSENGKSAIVVVRSQDHKDRWIMQLHPMDGTLSLIDRQRDEAWIEGPGIGGYSGTGNIGFINDSMLYYQSEATGYAHLYTFNLYNGVKKQLTSGNFEVQELLLSRDCRWFYMKTNEEHPGETHFYKMSVNGGERVRLTNMSGGNTVVLSPDEKMLAIRYSNTTTPWELYVQNNEPGQIAVRVTFSQTTEFKAYSWKKPEVVSFKARDGKEIFARVYQPRRKNGKGVIFVHGAGYLQNAHKWWSQYYREFMFHNLLVDKGYTVMDIDYRASSGYGRDVRTGIYRHMGGKDLTDNVDGARLLVSKYGVNTGKIGIYGGSYGGFITLMAMFTTPDVFAAGAALRPVTDWAAYNQGYTSNILNEPQNDSIAYRRSSPIFFAEGLKGKLLICHGQVDVNVHIQDSYRLTQRLIELKKENWEMASYPVEDHGFVQPESWMDEYKRILKLFESM